MVETRTETFGTGVVVEISRPRTALLNQLRTKYLKEHEEPEIPTVRNEDMGRDEPNPFDPKYVRDISAYYSAIADMMMDVIFATSVKVISVPDDVPDQDSEEFEAVLEMAGIKVPTDPFRRRVAWLKAIAATDTDIEMLQSDVIEVKGATEEQVEEATKMFRGTAE